VWDGRGAGRWPVRLAFWLLCGLGAVLTGARMVHVMVPAAVADAALYGLLGLYAVGQALGAWDRFRAS
jgi:hypothetical protein